MRLFAYDQREIRGVGPVSSTGAIFGPRHGMSEVAAGVSGKPRARHDDLIGLLKAAGRHFVDPPRVQCEIHQTNRPSHHQLSSVTGSRAKRRRDRAPGRQPRFDVSSGHGGQRRKPPHGWKTVHPVESRMLKGASPFKPTAGCTISPACRWRLGTVMLRTL